MLFCFLVGSYLVNHALDSSILSSHLTETRFGTLLKWRAELYEAEKAERRTENRWAGTPLQAKRKTFANC